MSLQFSLFFCNFEPQNRKKVLATPVLMDMLVDRCIGIGIQAGLGEAKTYRVSQNYPNMYFSTIISTAPKPQQMWIPKFSEILIKRQN